MDIKQKVHGALLTELLKEDERGKYINLIRLVRHAKLTVRTHVPLKNEKGWVDVVVSHLRGIYSTDKNRILIVKEDRIKRIAFELITDIGFDVDKKSEQANRYHQEYEDTRVIIPEEYEKTYATIFRINDIGVHTWKGTRRWKCKKCGKISYDKHTSMKPNMCMDGSCNHRELYFVGLEDVEFK